MTAKSGNKEVYGIGAVAKLTGLTDHTIRVWERRYAAVVAQRAPNGRREYTPSDVEKLGLLKRLTDQGLAISQIAGETIGELRDRMQSLNEFASTTVPDQVVVAVLGELLPDQFASAGRDLAPLEVAVADSSRDRFVADIARRPIDVVILECPILDNDATQQLTHYMEAARAARGVIVYRFGRDRDVEAARDSRIVTLRSPVDVDDVCAAVLRAYAQRGRGRSTRTTPADEAGIGMGFRRPGSPPAALPINSWSSWRRLRRLSTASARIISLSWSAS